MSPIVTQHKHMDFTEENNFFDDGELQFNEKRGRPSLVNWDNVINSNKWYFLNNTERSEIAIKNDSRPQPPAKLVCEGYKFTIKKCTHPNSGEQGLAIRCVQYPDDQE